MEHVIFERTNESTIHLTLICSRSDLLSWRRAFNRANWLIRSWSSRRTSLSFSSSFAIILYCCTGSCSKFHLRSSIALIVDVWSAHHPGITRQVGHSLIIRPLVPEWRTTGTGTTIIKKQSVRRRWYLLAPPAPSLKKAFTPSTWFVTPNSGINRTAHKRIPRYEFIATNIPSVTINLIHTHSTLSWSVSTVKRRSVDSVVWKSPFCTPIEQSTVDTQLSLSIVAFWYCTREQITRDYWIRLTNFLGEPRARHRFDRGITIFRTCPVSVP